MSYLINYVWICTKWGIPIDKANIHFRGMVTHEDQIELSGDYVT